MEEHKRSELDGAEIYGKLTPLSGAGDSKLDILGLGVYDGIRIENKYTAGASNPLTFKVINKARRQAKLSGCVAVLRIESPELKEPYLMVPESYFRRMHE